jgi:hypothetical protein
MVRSLFLTVAVTLLGWCSQAARTCAGCQEAIWQLVAEWNIMAPGLIKDLPAQLCATCPVPSSCQAVVTSGLEAFADMINGTDAGVVCGHLGLCNGTTIFV